jgi:dienelactone hydrolase
VSCAAGPVGSAVKHTGEIRLLGASDAPYTAEAVSIPTPRGYTLAGTLTRPKGAAKVPVVITISGSGPQERDSRLAPVPGYAIFRQVADTLGRRGIAVLRFDDRGVGESGGAATRASATSADFADDVHAVIAWLRARPDIDGTRVALAGHSEGGVIAPLVAARDPRVRAVALLAGPGYDGRRILMYQNELSIRAASGVTESQRDSLRRTVPGALDSIARVNPWYAFMKTDPPSRCGRSSNRCDPAGQHRPAGVRQQADTVGAIPRGRQSRGDRDASKTRITVFPDKSARPPTALRSRMLPCDARCWHSPAGWRPPCAEVPAPPPACQHSG